MEATITAYNGNTANTAELVEYVKERAAWIVTLTRVSPDRAAWQAVTDVEIHKIGKIKPEDRAALHAAATA